MIVAERKKPGADSSSAPGLGTFSLPASFHACPFLHQDPFALILYKLFNLHHGCIAGAIPIPNIQCKVSIIGSFGEPDHVIRQPWDYCGGMAEAASVVKLTVLP